MSRLVVVVALIAGLAPCAASAQAPEPPPAPIREFVAASGEAPSDDPTVLLARCDQRLSRCERDQTGVGYLSAAYLALWAILMAYFFTTRRRQRRLILEMRELEARLARLQDGRGPS